MLAIYVSGTVKRSVFFPIPLLKKKKAKKNKIEGKKHKKIKEKHTHTERRKAL